MIMRGTILLMKYIAIPYEMWLFPGPHISASYLRCLYVLAEILLFPDLCEIIY